MFFCFLFAVTFNISGNLLAVNGLERDKEWQKWQQNWKW